MTPTQQYNLSLNYLEGKNVPQDFKKSFDLNLKAAETGDHDAVLAMGWFYLNGIGIEADNEKAIIWYKKSARQGEPKAMFSLGQIYYDDHDYPNAKRWFEHAIKAGHQRSLFWMGKLHWHGRGTTKNRKRAMQLFSEAAKHKVKEAQRTLRWLNRSN